MKFHSLSALLLLALALPAHAAEQTVPELEYQSVLDGYQAYSEPEIQNWPQVNQLVKEIGGWRVYAREPDEDPTEKPQSHHQHGGGAQ
jgi:hypothetical protein